MLILGFRIITVTVASQYDPDSIIQKVQFNRPLSSEKIPSHYLPTEAVSTSNRCNLAFGPPRLEENELDVYYNTANTIFPLFAKLIDLGISNEFIAIFKGQISVHARIFQAWNDFEGHSSVQDQAEHADWDQQMIDLETEFRNCVLDLDSSSIESWNRLKVNFSNLIDVIDEKRASLSQSDDCQVFKSMARKANCFLSILEHGEALLVSSPKVSSNAEHDYADLLFDCLLTIHNHLDSNSIPNDWLDRMNLELKVHLKVLQQITKTVDPICIDLDSNPNEEDAESLQKLSALNTEAVNVITDRHHLILSTPLIVTDGKVLPPDNKQFYVYEEHLLKILIRLDAIPVHGSLPLRSTRKLVIGYCQAHLNQLDALRSLFTR